MKTNVKVVSLPVLQKKLKTLRRQGKKIAFTNGCFDLFHYGHVSYLESAKKSNRILVVGINSDASVRRIKGAKRPIITEKYRAALLAALECVDFVVVFPQDTPAKAIESIKPDVLIKGADWQGQPTVGSDFVRSHGGKVEYLKFIPGVSTTNLIETIVKRWAK